MATRRRKIARSAVRRVKRRESQNAKNTKLRTLRSRKNSTEKKRINIREMKGGGGKWRTFLVYYGPPIIRTNPKLRLLNPFVGVLLYNEGNWSLCISTYLGSSSIIPKAWAGLEWLDSMTDDKGNQAGADYNDSRRYDVLLYREQESEFDKAREIFDSFEYGGGEVTEDEIDEGDGTVKKEIVCKIINHLCGELTDEQKSKISTFIGEPTQTAMKLGNDNGQSLDYWTIDRFITFEKNLVLDRGFGDLSCYDIKGKKTKIIEKVPNGRNKPFHIESQSKPTSTPPPPPIQSPDETIQDFLLVEYDNVDNGSGFNFLMKNTKQTFFGSANKAPFNVETEYNKFLTDNYQLMGSSRNMPNVKRYLQEISEPGQDNTHLESLI